MLHVKNYRRKAFIICRSKTFQNNLFKIFKHQCLEKNNILKYLRNEVLFTVLTIKHTSQQVVEVQASKQSWIEFMAKDSSTNRVFSSKQSVGLESGTQTQQQH